MYGTAPPRISSAAGNAENRMPSSLRGWGTCLVGEIALWLQDSPI